MARYLSQEKALAGKKAGWQGLNLPWSMTNKCTSHQFLERQQKGSTPVQNIADSCFIDGTCRSQWNTRKK